MRLTRCFVPGPLAGHSALTLPPGPSRHVARVLRLRPGDALRLFDGRGGEFEAFISALGTGGVDVQVGAHHALERESSITITLLQAVARGDRMDFIVQKATELGAACIVPVIAERCVVRPDAAAARRRQAHWQAVAISACEKCGRNRIPAVHAPVPFEGAWTQAAAPVRWLRDADAPRALAVAARALAPPAAPGALDLLVGPEGGFSPQERAAAEASGFLPVRLGPRVLRAETAPLAALAAIQALLEDPGARVAARN